MNGSFLEILGCSGGVGDGLLTTSFRLGKNILIDAGTGLGSLSGHDMANIDHVFITHSHLDHIAVLPLLLERVYVTRTRPVVIYACRETLATLQEHVFNWSIYPDFAALPLYGREHNALIHYHTLKENQVIEVEGWRVHGVAMDHTVAGLSYIFKSDEVCFAFTGDTKSLSQLASKSLDILITEVSFPDELEKLAQTTRHMTPSMLKREVAQFSKLPRLWISHFKPDYRESLKLELASLVKESAGLILESGKTYPLSNSDNS